jgi:pyridoxamine 5'-phosphate oxidase
LEEEDIESAADPLAIFRTWLKNAEVTEPIDANAAALATATPDGTPSVRMVLIKGVDDRGFAFFTNEESQKGQELKANPRAALCFHWKSVHRQVRISGNVVEFPPSDADSYFQTRSRLSQLAAAASEQSRVLPAREVLLARVKELDKLFPTEIPRPEYWKGFALQPERIEFWKSREGRLHHRVLFIRGENGWTKELLYP